MTATPPHSSHPTPQASPAPSAAASAASSPQGDVFVLRGVEAGYGTPILHDVHVNIPRGVRTTLIGPNGCGKSTLLKTMCGLLEHSGEVEFEGQLFESLGRKERARRLSLLPQSPTAPDGLRVMELVARGRHPHQSWLQQFSAADAEAVDRALEATNLVEFAERPLSELSGGQRQRAWLAMAIAQDAPTVLLDEPTTYLDLTHSIDVLEMVTTLCREQGRTAVMVLHDLNLAVRYSDHLIAMRQGRVVAAGTPEEIITPELLAEVFALDAHVMTCPVTGKPLIIPKERNRRA
ncbi:cobalamin/Fe(3+)-siderophore ABC transporter ATP-binding protein [Corynebacterium sp. 13CS0277]|uniref:ABC transporter ATP-binding protein n=1 Tax=Corynebacterium sp. 13CS0277 TaxID=2071994 RepID=UPI000D024C71|nr:ABC transporter ATP-binding protein [Corynebacterium sp. 13CS0277]PRQ11226.1 cobalamin/Fe(3+)-siderophore ABC transporter ATP-binding protein [Corynebacterium sp. 13CS0277]